eukprot:TRINITY_DN3099_c0_g1_i1.p1 TRINITY_DN3099_c0_g1~~TRINITY_DN3099_c0_g1_i1.p1  ORF type:complete len:322 (+),score=57.47 TRINITY_DN3099_c0_g1_i1:51-968(+)
MQSSAPPPLRSLLSHRLGFGPPSFSGGFGDEPQDQSDAAVARALDIGIKYFDSAPCYSSSTNTSERILGTALAHSGAPRSSFVVSTKCGRYVDPTLPNGLFDFSAKKVSESVRESLDRMQLTYLDMITVHDIEFATDLNQIITETVPALRELQAQGLIHYVGISGYPLDVLLYVAQRVKVDYVMSYCQLTLQNTLLAEYLPEFEKVGCVVLNAAPLSMRLLTKIGPASWHPCSPELKTAAHSLPTFCEEKGLTLADTAIRYALHHPSMLSGEIPVTVLGFKTAKEVELANESLNTPPNKELVDTI